MAKAKARAPAESWARQKGESEEAYASFLAYRDQGDERSLDAVKRSLGDGGAKSASLLARWSSRHDWVERCRLWDVHLQEQRDEEVRKRVRKFQRARLDEAEETLSLGQGLRKGARQILELPNVKVSSKSGGNVTILEPVRVSKRDAAFLARTGTDLVGEAIASVLGPPRVGGGGQPGDESEAEASADAPSPEAVRLFREVMVLVHGLCDPEEIDRRLAEIRATAIAAWEANEP